MMINRAYVREVGRTYARLFSLVPMTHCVKDPIATANRGGRVGLASPLARNRPGQARAWRAWQGEDETSLGVRGSYRHLARLVGCLVTSCIYRVFRSKTPNSTTLKSLGFFQAENGHFRGQTVMLVCYKPSPIGAENDEEKSGRGCGEVGRLRVGQR